jgi:hypothetical protein
MQQDPTSSAESSQSEEETIIRFPAPNLRGGVVPLVIVGVTAVLILLPIIVCLCLLFLCVGQLLSLAGWGPDDLILIRGATSWVPVAGAGLAILTVAFAPAWLIARVGAQWWRRVRKAWWLRLSSKGFEINDRVFAPRRYEWREIDEFMLVAPGGHVRDAVPQPSKTYAEAFRDGTHVPPTVVGFRYSPRSGRRRSLASRIFFNASAADGTKADGPVVGYWDRPFDEAVDLLNEWRLRYTST